MKQIYRTAIATMLSKIDDEKFLCQIYTILMCYMRRKGGDQ